MKDKGIHEGCIEQMYRQFNDKLYSGKGAIVDEKHRLRLDDWELRDDVQKEVLESWNKVKDIHLTWISFILNLIFENHECTI